MIGESLSPAELAFRALLAEPQAYAEWADGVRQQWEREHGVEWLHGYRDGREVWRGVRPPDDPDNVARFRMNPNRAARYAAKLAASRASIGDVPR